MGHHHHHHHHPKDYSTAFAFGVFLNVSFVLAEVFYGMKSQSLALLADAGHNFGDVLGLLMSWGAIVLAKKAPSSRFTYGLRSTTILAALVNAILLLLATGAIMLEAAQRLGNPAEIAASTVIWVALLGVLVNGATAFLLASGCKHDLNIRAAFLHMAGDAGISAAVALSAWVIMATGWFFLDSAASIVVSILIIASTVGLLKDSLGLSLHAVPANIDPVQVRAYLAALSGVREVHDLHIWGMSTSASALTVHLVMPGGQPGDAFLAETTHELQHRFGIEHATIQVEMGDAEHPCSLAPEHVI